VTRKVVREIDLDDTILKCLMKIVSYLEPTFGYIERMYADL
jgi:hypothetical protein